MDEGTYIQRQTAALRRRALKTAAAMIYIGEYKAALVEGCTNEEAKDRAWSARETAREALLAAQP